MQRQQHGCEISHTPCERRRASRSEHRSRFMTALGNRSLTRHYSRGVRIHRRPRRCLRGGAEFLDFNGDTVDTNIPDRQTGRGNTAARDVRNVTDASPLLTYVAVVVPAGEGRTPMLMNLPLAVGLDWLRRRAEQRALLRTTEELSHSGDDALSDIGISRDDITHAFRRRGRSSSSRSA